MWFSLFALVLILTITFYQGLQGMFTAVINCILTILAAALAFGLYEDIYYAFLIDRQPDYGRPIALMAVFIIAMLVLRLVFDSLIKGNMQFPVYVDRAGGGLFGLVTALITVGMLAIAFNMLPFGPVFLGFSRYTLVDKGSGEPVIKPKTENSEATDATALDWSNVRQDRHSLWLQPDALTVGLMSHLSSNSLAGRNRLSDVYPDLLMTIHHARANPLGKSRPVANKDALQVVGFWDMAPNELYTYKLSEDKKNVQIVPAREPVPAGRKRIAVRVKLGNDAKDPDSTYRFIPEQVRLIVPDDKGGKTQHFILAGISDEKFPNRIIHVVPGQGIGLKPEKPDIDLAFVVPENLRITPGSYIMFKQNGRAEVSPGQDMNKKKPAPLSIGQQPKGGTGPRTGNENRNTITPPKPQGRVSVLGPAREMVVSDQLPWSITNYGGQAEVSGGKIRSARHMVAELDENWQPLPGNQPPAESIDVPSGQRLLQVSLERLIAGSTLGQALSFARENVGDFYLVDEAGKEHRPVGVYAMAEVGGKKLFEMILLEASERDFARLPRLERIKGSNMRGDYALVYMFAVPPGTKPASVHTGGKKVELQQFNLTVE